jgi:hypothetical protein
MVEVVEVAIVVVTGEEEEEEEERRSKKRVHIKGVCLCMYHME